VANDTRDFYRYVDCTTLTEILFSFVEETIEKEIARGNPLSSTIRHGPETHA
jgi:hypothetical protein